MTESTEAIDSVEADDWAQVQEQAELRAETLFDALWSNNDAADVKASRKLVAGDYAFIKNNVITPDSDAPWVTTWKPEASTKPDVRRHLRR